MEAHGVVHDFWKCRADSHASEDLPFWGEVYREAFGENCKMISHRQDGEHQRAGIDRSVILPNAKQILIDEKCRGRNRATGKVYNDIALEYEHKYTNGRILPGWVCKPLRADYIAYAIVPLGKCYLLPVIELQKSWRQNKAEWLSRFPTIQAQNQGYVSYSCILEIPTLFKAIGNCLRVSFTAGEVCE